MYYCVENTFITTKSRTSSPIRSASLPAHLHEPARHADPGVSQVQTLEKRASYLKVFAEARKADGCSEAKQSISRDVLSSGSAGHPEYCRKPCIWLRFGCPKGRQCEFCHCPHGPSAKLDKRQRALLRGLSEQDRLNLVLPHLKVRAEKLPGADRVVDLMEEQLTRLVGPKTPIWKVNQLSQVLLHMSFVRLMQICPCSNLEPIQIALLELRSSCGEASTD
ncbi:unnamed protein product [Effrenium voratum]|nr:unnamed protein product [Effrenium voratum]